MNSVLPKASYLIIFFSLMFIFYIGYLLFYPFPTIWVRQPYEIINEPVPGGTIEYEVEYCRYTDGNSDVIHNLHGDKSTKLPNDSISTITLDNKGLRLQKGCGKVLKVVPIPKFIPPGNYYIEETIYYNVSPLQKRKRVFKSKPFQIK